MEQDRAYLEELADKWVRGTITQAEADVLIAWYNSQDDTKNAYYSDTIRSEEELRNQALQTLLKRIIREGRPAALVSFRQKRYLRYIPYAAAIFIVTLAAVIYFYPDLRPNRNGKNLLLPEAGLTDQDIPPGGNRATLTLANGSKIDLDSGKVGIRVSNEHIRYSDNTSLNIMLPVPNAGLGGAGSGKGTHSAEVFPKDIGVIGMLQLSTPKGGQYQITLSDGTHVWLNAASTLTYPTKFRGNNRTVELVGEAFFDVAIDKRKPFIVNSNGQETQVMGTAFNISSYAGDASVKTTLVSGCVKVSSLRSQQGTDELILYPNEQATFTIAGALRKEKVDPASFVAWKSGDFYFKNTSFEDMMQQLIRWYDIDVIYQNTVPKETFSGIMERNVTLQTVLEFLRGSSIKFRLEGKQLVIK